MRQKQWHQVVKRHLLGPLSDLWPGVTVHKSWIVVRDDDHLCYAIGWGVPKWSSNAVYNYAKIHLDFASETPFAINDLYRQLGAQDKRDGPVEIPDDDEGEAAAMHELLSRIQTEAAPFFESLSTSERISELLAERADEEHPLQLGRLEKLAGLRLLADDRSAVELYRRALQRIDQQMCRPHSEEFAARREWLSLCLDAAASDRSAALQLLDDQAARYRKEGGLPPSP